LQFQNPRISIVFFAIFSPLSTAAESVRRYDKAFTHTEWFEPEETARLDCKLVTDASHPDLWHSSKNHSVT
jgi:hypothetical protein